MSPRKNEAAAIAALAAPQRAPDQFTLIETIIAEIRAMPPDEPRDQRNWYSVESVAAQRRNERLEAARAVAFRQLASACLSDNRLRHYLVQAGL